MHTYVRRITCSALLSEAYDGGLLFAALMLRCIALGIFVGAFKLHLLLSCSITLHSQKPLPVLLNDPRPSTTTSSFRVSPPASVQLCAWIRVGGSAGVRTSANPIPPCIE